MTPVGVGFGVALGVAAVLAGKSPQRAPSVACVAMLGMGWAVAVTTAPIAGQNENVLLIWAAMDAIFGSVAVILWTRHKRPAWLIVLALLYLGQGLCHVRYFSGAYIPEPRLRTYEL